MDAGLLLAWLAMIGLIGFGIVASVREIGRAKPIPPPPPPYRPPPPPPPPRVRPMTADEIKSLELSLMRLIDSLEELDRYFAEVWYPIAERVGGPGDPSLADDAWRALRGFDAVVSADLIQRRGYARALSNEEIYRVLYIGQKSETCRALRGYRMIKREEGLDSAFALRMSLAMGNDFKRVERAMLLAAGDLRYLVRHAVASAFHDDAFAAELLRERERFQRENARAYS